MNKFNFNFVHFSKWVGILCILFAAIMFVNVVVFEVLDYPSRGLISIAFNYILYGIIIIGIGKLVDLFERHYQEMKFFRKHYIEKDKQIAKVLQDKEKNDV